MKLSLITKHYLLTFNVGREVLNVNLMLQLGNVRKVGRPSTTPGITQFTVLVYSDFIRKLILCNIARNSMLTTEHKTTELGTVMIWRN